MTIHFTCITNGDIPQINSADLLFGNPEFEEWGCEVDRERTTYSLTSPLPDGRMLMSMTWEDCYLLDVNGDPLPNIPDRFWKLPLLSCHFNIEDDAEEGYFCEAVRDEDYYWGSVYTRFEKEEK